MCLTLPEDVDGYQDGDGCPDRITMKTATRRARRRPLEAEDFDQFNYGDGCRDWDNDRGSSCDDVDRCRNEPEDLDGHQDADGCPDPDNDGDGVLDVEDACPFVKESPMATSMRMAARTTPALSSRPRRRSTSKAGGSLRRGHPRALAGFA